jgi:predicted membrane-bound spermidine synthase
MFPLAAAVCLRDRAATGRAAGAVDAADNIGACLGAIATGMLLVPILGVSGACLVVAAIKALSALLLGAATLAREPRAA